MDKTFISYNRNDLKFAQRLLRALHSRGLDPWLDVEDLEPAQPWHSGMLLGVQFAENLLFVISPDSVKSDYCLQELDSATRHEKRLIPVLYRDVSPHLVHPALRELQWIFARHNDDFETAIGKIIAVVESPRGFHPLNDRLQAEVEVLDSQGSRTITLQRQSYIVGRTQIASQEFGSIAIFDNDRTISRRHCQLFFEGGGWKVVDLSRNGIELFPKCPGGRLKDGTKIFLGHRACLIYRELQKKAPPPVDEYPTIGGEDAELIG